MREIWFNTGKCIDHFLYSENRKPYLFELVWFAALANGLYLSVDKGFPMWPFLIIAIPPLTALYLRYFSPWILLKVGKLMDGKATLEEFRLIISLSSIPFIIDIIYLLLTIVIPGDQPILNIVIYYLSRIFWIRILIIGVAKIQRISYTFAFMNIFIPYFILIIVELQLK